MKEVRFKGRRQKAGLNTLALGLFASDLQTGGLQ